jgi:arylsulfatase A-like enzyme
VFDGVDLMPYVNGDMEGVPHEVFYWRADHIHAMRKDGYKYILSTRDNWSELYHIEKDTYESTDIFEHQNDIFQKLQQDYNKWQEELAKPMWPRIMDHEFEIDGKTYLFPA